MRLNTVKTCSQRTSSVICRLYPPRTIVTCSNAYNPCMSGYVDRWFTFQNWPRCSKLPSPNRLSEAGFFYLNYRDRVKCFSCNGVLQKWKHLEDPWTEHAKRFPECEFLQLSRGAKFIQRIVNLNPDVHRQQIHNPIPLSSSDVTSEPVDSDDVTKRRKMLSSCAHTFKAMPLPVFKLEKERGKHDTASSFVEDLYIDMEEDANLLLMMTQKGPIIWAI